MRDRTPSLLLLTAFLLAALALFPGCSEETSPVQNAPAPDVDPYFAGNATGNLAGGLWADYYPLRTGNRWRSERRFRVWDDDGNVINDITGESTRELIGQEELAGRIYTVEEWTMSEGIEGEVHSTTYWIRYRQDRDGLYEADVTAVEPPTLLASPGKENQRRTLTTSAWNDDGAVQAMVRQVKDPTRRAAIAAHLVRHRQVVAAALFGATAYAASAGPEAGEITRLLYPLRRGRSWVIRDEPLFTAEVEGRELLRLPIGRRVGVRVRITPPGAGPDDEVFLWFSSCGMLRLYARLQGEMTDPDGTPLGTINTEEIVELVEADVGGRPWCGR